MLLHSLGHRHAPAGALCAFVRACDSVGLPVQYPLMEPSESTSTSVEWFAQSDQGQPPWVIDPGPRRADAAPARPWRATAAFSARCRGAPLGLALLRGRGGGRGVFRRDLRPPAAGPRPPGVVGEGAARQGRRGRGPRRPCAPSETVVGCGGGGSQRSTEGGLCSWARHLALKARVSTRHCYSGAEFVVEADARAPESIKRIGSGPRASASTSNCAPV